MPVRYPKAAEVEPERDPTASGLPPLLRRIWAQLRTLPEVDEDAMCHRDVIPPNVLVEDGRLLAGGLDERPEELGGLGVVARLAVPGAGAPTTGTPPDTPGG